jgi:hypothetical protein
MEELTKIPFRRRDPKICWNSPIDPLQNCDEPAACYLETYFDKNTILITHLCRKCANQWSEYLCLNSHRRFRYRVVDRDPSSLSLG